MLHSHTGLMFIYAACAGAFFALFLKETRRERIRLFLFVFCALFLGGIVLGWAMVPFPHR